MVRNGGSIYHPVIILADQTTRCGWVSSEGFRQRCFETADIDLARHNVHIHNLYLKYEFDGLCYSDRMKMTHVMVVHFLPWKSDRSLSFESSRLRNGYETTIGCLGCHTGTSAMAGCRR